MLRLVFACALILFGATQSVRGPFYALAFYLWFAYFRPETWIWYDTLRSLNLSFLIGAWAVVFTLLSSKEKLTRSAPVFLIAAFLIHGLLSTLLSDYYWWSIIWWRGFAKVAVVTILIISLVNTRERFKLTVVIIAIALGLEGVKQGWFYLLTQPGERNLNEVEILGDNNGVAVGMLMLSALLLPLFQTARKKSHKGALGFMLLGCIFRALSTFSRGGMLAFAAMTAVYWTRSKHKIRTAILIGAVAGGLLGAMPPAFWQRMNTINVDASERDYSTAGRLFFWGVATRMANDHPVFGIGHTAFQVAYNHYDPTGGAYGRGRAVHSTWFGVLAEQGYVGLIMLVSIIVMSLRACGRVRKMTRGNPNAEELFAYAGGMQAALVAAIVGGTFLSYHYVEVLWHFVGLGFALEGAARYELALDQPQKTAAVAPSQSAFGIPLPARLIASSGTTARR